MRYTVDEDDKFSISRGLILALEKPINPEQFVAYNEINSEYKFGELLQEFVEECFV